MTDRLLANKKGMLLKMYDGPDLASDAVARFPGLKPQLEEAEEQIHGLMQVLATAAMQGVRESNLATVLAIWSFLEEVLSNPRAHSEIENAVRISFMNQGELLINSTGRKALDQMPARLRRAVLQAYPPA
jgi:hypothetical protein